MSKSVKRKAHDLKRLQSHLDVSVSKRVRLLNAGAYGAFLADGVDEDEWELSPTRKESQSRGAVVSKVRYATLEKVTVGRGGDAISVIGAGCPLPQRVRLRRDTRWRITDPGDSNSTSIRARGGPHRSTNSTVARLSPGLGTAVGDMYKEKACRVEGGVPR